MSGTVTMKDAKTGAVIKTGDISITDAPFRGDGIGVFVAIAVNASTTPEKRYASMTEKFAIEALLQLK